MQVLLLTTVGRKTGEPRTIALNYVTEEDKIVVAASNAGEASHPAWYLNLKSNPSAELQIRNKRFEILAREAHRDERRRLWERIVQADRSYAEYQSRTTRLIPVLVLEPAVISER